MMAGPSDVQIMTAGLSNVLQTMMAGLSEIISLRKRKDEEPTKSKKAKKAKLISADNPKEKGKKYILLYILLF